MPGPQPRLHLLFADWPETDKIMWQSELDDDDPFNDGIALVQPEATDREGDYALGPGFCCVCGQPVYRLGWHVDLWKSGPNKNAVWHCACVVAWQFWNAPNSQIQLLRRIQSRRCAQSGGRLWRNAEVDRVPLFRVWSEHRDTSWPRLLDFWGLPNLQVINRDVHAAKCATEARDRRVARTSPQTHLR